MTNCFYLDEPELLPGETFGDGRERDETEDDGRGEPDDSCQEVGVVEQRLLLLRRLHWDGLFQDLKMYNKRDDGRGSAKNRDVIYERPLIL